MKSSFTVQFAAHLLVAALGLSGFPASALAWITSEILGKLLDLSIIKIDIQIDKLKEALKDEHWHDAALKAYNAASSKALTEEGKNAARKQYEDAIRNYATYGLANN